MFPFELVLFNRELYNSFIFGRASILQAHDIRSARVDLTAFRFKNWMRRETITWMPLISSWTWKTSDETSPNMSGSETSSGRRKNAGAEKMRRSAGVVERHAGWSHHVTPPFFGGGFSFNGSPPLRYVMPMMGRRPSGNWRTSPGGKEMTTDTNPELSSWSVGVLEESSRHFWSHNSFG